MDIDYPFHIDAGGRTARTGREDHVRDLIEQVLFTSPGERLNRPNFGTGVMQLVFAPSGDELATTAQFLIQGALQQFLGELIQIENVGVTSGDSTVEVTVSYALRTTGEQRTDQFERRIG
jgi:phage baseplate assembly protein W